VARQLKERPCKTLEFETRQSGLTPVLHRPVEITGVKRTLKAASHQFSSPAAAFGQNRSFNPKFSYCIDGQTWVESRRQSAFKIFE